MSGAWPPEGAGPLEGAGVVHAVTSLGVKQ